LEDALKWRAVIDAKEQMAKSNSNSPFSPRVALSAQFVVASSDHRDVAPVLQSVVAAPLKNLPKYCNLDAVSNDKSADEQQQLVQTDIPKSPFILELSAKDLELYSRPEKNILVTFYASWCPASQDFMPTYQKLGAALSTRTDVKVTAIDVGMKKDIAKLFGIHQLPTVMMFPAHQSLHPQAVFTYAGEQEVQHLRAWVDDKVLAGVQLVSMEPKQ
jgi:thiol-disulfide isomerase/thioredoxin